MPEQFRTHSLFRLRACLRRAGLTWPGLEVLIEEGTGQISIAGRPVVEDPKIPLDVLAICGAAQDAKGRREIRAAIGLTGSAQRVAVSFLDRRRASSVAAAERASRGRVRLRPGTSG